MSFKALEEAKSSIQDLFTKITDIKEKAEKSEQMVCSNSKHYRFLYVWSFNYSLS